MKELPLWARPKAERELKDVIYEMLEDYTEGDRPVGRDARAVLKELGTPEEIAAQYYEHRRHTKKKIKMNTKKTIRLIVRIVFILSMALVVFGILILATGLSSNMLPILLGAILALGVILANMFLPMPDGQIREKRARR